MSTTTAPTTQPAPQRPAARRIARLALVVAAVATFATACLSADQTSVVDHVNRSRADVRLSSLKVDQGASQKAQRWSQSMATKGVLEHTGGGSRLDTSGLTNWCSVGENVGKGTSVAAVHEAFMKSAAHKANILGRYDRVGVGVVKSGRTYWVTQIFLRSC